MSARGAVDPAHTRAGVLAVAPWLRDDTTAGPNWQPAVRLAARTLAALAPGCSAPIFIRCTLNTDRFVLAVIPSRKRITQKISVRFARRPFRNNICGPTL
jgi:hypothetical protein